MTDEEIEKIAKAIAEKVREGNKKRKEYSTSWNPEPGGPIGDF